MKKPSGSEKPKPEKPRPLTKKQGSKSLADAVRKLPKGVVGRKPTDLYGANTKASPSKSASEKKNRPTPNGRDAQTVALITTDEDGVEHWEGTLDEELAINAGGTYEWTDDNGVRHKTEVTPEGTHRTETAADGMSSGTSFTPHERREGGNGADQGADGALGIVGDVLSEVLPYVAPFVGGAGNYNPGYFNPGFYNPGYVNPGYYDPGYSDAGYVVPGIAVPADTAAGAGYFDAAMIPATLVGDGGREGTPDRDVTRFTRRLLYLKNVTAEPVKVYIQFRSQTESGDWAWIPADPAASQESLAVELAPGQEGYVQHDGGPIAASRVRIWGNSASRQWQTHRDEDLWLVSEVDGNGERAYHAAALETFPFVFE
ncbi:MAG: hypothetical protein A2W31_09865 [Planctomycetes bacterium RBG_16_64_10]|nr:MAG: hypothetical protein A2W31_09865 [Planctomycetes bacterium RBG_16_64_10]